MTEMEHEIVVLGIWCNDSTADVGLWCNTCNESVDPGYSPEWGFPIEAVVAAAEAHRQNCNRAGDAVTDGTTRRAVKSVHRFWCRSVDLEPSTRARD